MGLVEGIFEEGLSGLGSTMLLGVGAVLAAPVIIPAAMGGIRPLIKTAVKGYVYVSDSLRESLAEAGEQFTDLVEEVRAEARAAEHDMHTTRSSTAQAEHSLIATPGESAHEETETRRGRRKDS